MGAAPDAVTGDQAGFDSPRCRDETGAPTGPTGVQPWRVARAASTRANRRRKEPSMRRNVRDVMTTRVATASPDTTYKQLVQLLAEHRVSAVPVVDERRHVLGVVSEADLLLKQEHPQGLAEALGLGSRRRRVERAKAGGAVAADLMTSPVITVGRETSAVEAARPLHAKGVKRLPVEDALGRLVGVVSRADLLAGFLRTDEEIRREILEDLIRHDFLMGPERFDVNVRDGVVVLQAAASGAA
jgi:CBS domain-containing protein